ncbi:TPA: hypothetical protein ACQYCZ_004402 [Vibrio parahaemolyticus]|jgi:hypothetical protein
MSSKAIVDEVQKEIWDELGVSVLINNMGPYLVIDEEEPNTFENISGTSRQICFKRTEQVAVVRGDTISFVDSGEKAVCTTPLTERNFRKVVRYEYESV